MTANHDHTAALRTMRTSTGMLDHAVIESRARQLRSEALRALFHSSARRALHALATGMRWTDKEQRDGRDRRRGAKECPC